MPIFWTPGMAWNRSSMVRYRPSTWAGHRNKHARAAVGDNEASHSADDREDNTLCEELANDSYSHRAQRCSDGHLFAAVRSANEQKVGDVSAGDEEYEAGDPHEKLE